MLYERGILKNSQIKFTDTKFTDKHKKQSFRGTLLKEVLQNILQKTQNYIFPESHFLKIVAGWNPKTVRSTHWRCPVKIGDLKNFVNFTGKYFCWSLFFKKLQF